MADPKRISTDGGGGLGHNPFAALSGAGLPPAPAGSVAAGGGPTTGANPAAKAVKNRGRVDITREKAGRGGKTVTVVSGFTGIGLPEKETLAKQMQRACGCGGTVKDGRIEVQGDNRDKVAEILRSAGFQPVFAGG
ncbi:translation initiation factor [Nibricoccus sp. IMCC34717]|uniref:translation initiation factor n=1 Tax=Nibricoccus sp. IMCC34717 TaxID=3034021 RepID=UPI00384E4608